MANGEIVIPKTWRSEMVRVVIFLILCITSVLLSKAFPGSVIRGRLLTVFGHTLYLSLPLFWLIPFGALVDVCVRIFNVRYVVDAQGIEARQGILSLNQTITRVRYEDVRSVEIDQSLLDRILNIGVVAISTAGTDGVEVVFQGVAAPREIQLMLQAERDRRERTRAKDQPRSLASNTE